MMGQEKGGRNGMTQRACKWCLWLETQHTYVCNCGHEHNDHVFAGGCTQCKCSRYDQTKQLTADGWKKEQEKEATKSKAEVLT